MNRAIPYIFVMILPTTTLWLMGSFINWEPNPAHWSELFRAVISLMWIASNTFMLVAVVDHWRSQQ